MDLSRIIVVFVFTLCFKPKFGSDWLEFSKCKPPMKTVILTVILNSGALLACGSDGGMRRMGGKREMSKIFVKTAPLYSFTDLSTKSSACFNSRLFYNQFQSIPLILSNQFPCPSALTMRPFISSS